MFLLCSFSSFWHSWWLLARATFYLFILCCCCFFFFVFMRWRVCMYVTRARALYAINFASDINNFLNISLCSISSWVRGAWLVACGTALLMTAKPFIWLNEFKSMFECVQCWQCQRKNRLCCTRCMRVRVDDVAFTLERGKGGRESEKGARRAFWSENAHELNKIESTWYIRLSLFAHTSPHGKELLYHKRACTQRSDISRNRERRWSDHVCGYACEHPSFRNGRWVLRHRRAWLNSTFHASNDFDD